MPFASSSFRKSGVHYHVEQRFVAAHSSHNTVTQDQMRSLQRNAVSMSQMGNVDIAYAGRRVEDGRYVVTSVVNLNPNAVSPSQCFRSPKLNPMPMRREDSVCLNSLGLSGVPRLASSTVEFARFTDERKATSSYVGNFLRSLADAIDRLVGKVRTSAKLFFNLA